MQVRPTRRIHSVGTVFRGTFTGAASAPWLRDIAWLAPGRAHAAIVRCSPFMPPMAGIPGVVCLALRIVDAGGDDQAPEVDQDLLFFAVHRARAFRLVPAVRVHADRLLFRRCGCTPTACSSRPPCRTTSANRRMTSGSCSARSWGPEHTSGKVQTP